MNGVNQTLIPKSHLMMSHGHDGNLLSKQSKADNTIYTLEARHNQQNLKLL